MLLYLEELVTIFGLPLLKPPVSVCPPAVSVHGYDTSNLKTLVYSLKMCYNKKVTSYKVCST